MTTIVYRDGILAGDRRVTNNGLIEPDVTKIFKRESDGALIGVAGTLGLGMRFAKWFLGGEIGEAPVLADQDNNTEAEALIVRPDGALENYYKSGIICVEAGFYAIGSGACAALTALDLGCSAEEAVRAASRRDTGTSADVNTLCLDRAIAALEPPPAAVTEPEPTEPEPQDDASEFSEEGYAPVTQADPPAMEGVAFVDGKWTIPGPSFEELDDDGLEPGPVDEASHPMAAYVPATDPQADALAKAADWYSPEAVAERNRFDPFRMFKRETEES